MGHYWKNPIVQRAAIVAVVAIACFLNSVGGEFVWADHTVISEGEAILHSPGEVISAFVRPMWAFTGVPTEGRGGYYRPIVSVSYTLDHMIWGDNPVGYHITNIVVHAANSLLLFLLLTALFPKSSIPFLAGLLFAVHPIHTEAVSWISGRTGLLGAIGVLGALTLHAHAHVRKERKLLIAAAATMAFGLFSKEVAVVTPLLILLVNHAQGGRKNIFVARRDSAYFAVLAGYLLMRFTALQGFGTGSSAAIDPALLVATMIRVLAGYLRLMIVPFPLHTNDAVKISSVPFDPRAFLALIFLAGVLYAFWRLGKERRATNFGLIWMAIAILPFLNLVPLVHFRAERLLYLPSAGFVIAAAAILDRWGSWIAGKERRFGLSPGEIAAIGLCAIFAVLTVARNRVWESDRVLFSDTVAKNRHAPEAYYMLGSNALRHGAYADAVNLLRASLSTDPGYVAFLPVPWALSNLGYAHYRLGDYPNAVAAFQNSLGLLPTLERASFGKALALSRLGEHGQAIEIYQSLIRGEPDHEDAHYNLALEFESIDSLSAAEREYGEVLRINPDRKEAFTNLGSVLAQSGRSQAALDSYNRALSLEPNDPKLHFNVGLLYATEGEVDRAIGALREALRIDPSFEDAEHLLEELAGDTLAAP